MLRLLCGVGQTLQVSFDGHLKNGTSHVQVCLLKEHKQIIKLEKFHLSV